MAMNTPRIIGGGLAAGVVLNVVDFVVNGVILKSRMAAEMNAAAPGLADKAMGGSTIATYVILDFVLGIMLVWLYAAVRPRFGPGPRTAAYVGLFYWILGGIFYWNFVIFGLTIASTFAIASVIQLVNCLVAANVGAMVYKEESTPA